MTFAYTVSFSAYGICYVFLVHMTSEKKKKQKETLRILHTSGSELSIGLFPAGNRMSIFSSSTGSCVCARHKKTDMEIICRSLEAVLYIQSTVVKHILISR